MPSDPEPKTLEPPDGTRRIELVPRFEGQGYAPEHVAARRAWLEDRTGCRLEHLGRSTLETEALRGNIENAIGAAQVPVGVAGPLAVRGEHAAGTFFVPLATTEGVLVRSYERGMVALTRAGGAEVRLSKDENRVAPIFLLEDVAQAHEFSLQVQALFEEIRAQAESTTRHGRLLRLECLPLGRRVIVNFCYFTGDAQGMNMIAKATERACRFIQERLGAQRYLLFSGYASEKRASGALLAGGKGKRVTAGARLPRRVVRSVLNTTPEQLVALWHDTVLGHLQAGALGYNGHFANGLAAIFIACGQDVANVANSAVGITQFELVGEGDLFASVTLPSLSVATIGGGTALGTARECLALLGCTGAGQAPKLAEIVAAALLGGELSMGAALASGEFVAAHEAYGRNPPPGAQRGVKRPFRELRESGPRASYDAVVVGAGIGGLVCANLLAQRGLAVLLVEQHYMVGGYCSTFRRKGYTFDASTHFYPLLGNPQTLTGRMLRELGVQTRWVKMDPVDTFHLPDGTRFSVPADFETYRAQLWAAFPHEQAALEHFFACVREAYVYGLLLHFRGRKPRGEAPYRDWTVREALDRHFQDPRLKLLLTADCAHWGSPPARTSFVFDSMLRLSYFLGNYYPVGGSQAFADELARCFEARGGQILMSTRATRILVESDRVRGVELLTTRGRLRGLRAVAATSVVANGDQLLTLERLLGAEHVPAEYLARLRRLRPTFPCFLTHVGLRGVPEDALERAQGYYWDGWDPDRVGTDALRFKIFAPTLYEPAMAPPGGQIVILQKVLELDPASITDWPAHRDALERRLLAWLEAALPGCAARTVVALSASARTAERFTSNRGGAMLGWEMSPDQLGDARGGVQSPVAGLYFVGHWTRPGGGITPVMVSSQQVADAIARRAAEAPPSSI